MQSGETPLHFACRNGHYEIVKALIEKVFKVKSPMLARLVVNIPNDVSFALTLFVNSVVCLFVFLLWRSVCLFVYVSLCFARLLVLVFQFVCLCVGDFKHYSNSIVVQF